jgi:ABC-type branched-subunit amino acid transport system ATPase component
MDVFVGNATDAETITTPVLRVLNVVKSYDAARVLDDVSFDVLPRQVTGLIGPNGAGKTTLFNLIAGVDDPDRGAILLREQSIVGLSTPARVALGITRTFQEIRLFASLTALENVMVGCRSDDGASLATTLLRWRRSRQYEREIREQARRQLELVGLADVADRLPSELSYGQQKRVGIARALATGRDLLCLDEPAAGLDPEAARELVELIHGLALRVGTILLIEHNLELVREVCRQVLFFDSGRIVVAGSPDEVLGDARVWRAFMGL